MPREAWPPKRIHVSELSKFALSAAHFKAAHTDRKEAAAHMRFGSAVHAALLGGASLAVFDGDARRGKAWDAFESSNADKDIIVTAPEWERVKRVADAVRSDRVAAPFLEGRTEQYLEWDAYGIQCAGTVDVIHENALVDVKTCSIAQPNIFQVRSLRLAYHAKMAWYLRGLKENKMPRERAILLAVEVDAPFAVTVFELTPRALEQGDKTIRRWVEAYKNCAASNVWPAYSQCIVPFDVPEETELTFGADPEWAEGA